MAYLPVKARSEFVIPANFGDGGVCESTWRFHDASPALNSPALRPTRGSGFGAAVDIVAVEAPVVTGALAGEIAVLHAAAERAPMASDSLNTEWWVMDIVE